MRIDVSFEAFQAESARLDDIAGAMSRRIASARSHVDELVGSGWSGGAAQAFSTEFANWATVADDGVSTLRALVNSMRVTANEFAEAEQLGSRMSNELEANLGSLGIAKIGSD